MNNVIKVRPDKDGKIFITLYGTKYEIVIENKKEKLKEDKSQES